MEPPLDILWFLIRPQLLSKCYGSIVIAIKWYDIRCHNPKLRDEFLKPEFFFCSIQNSNIFSFCGRIHYDGLLGTLLVDCATIACEHISWCRLSIIRIRHEVWISIPLDSQFRPPPKIKNKSLVLLKYLRMFFIAIQCSSPAFDWYLLVTQQG